MAHDEQRWLTPRLQKQPRYATRRLLRANHRYGWALIWGRVMWCRWSSTVTGSR